MSLEGFEKPTGSHADVAEFEYLCALHQTSSSKLRETIKAKDVATFLRSRYGINIDDDVVRDVVMYDFGANDSTLGLCQMMTLILTPTLYKVSCFGDTEAIDKFFGRTFDTLLLDTGLKRNATLNQPTVRQILETYGEVDEEMTSDKVVSEMVALVGGGVAKLNLETFRCALVSDLQQLNPEADSSLSTHWQDVFLKQRNPRRIPLRPQEFYPSMTFTNETIVSKAVRSSDLSQRNSQNPGYPQHDKLVQVSEWQDEEHGTEQAEPNQKVNEFEYLESLPFIDRVAENYPSQIFAVTVMVGFSVLYFAYVFDIKTGFDAVECGNFGSDLGCMTAAGIVNWLLISIQLVLIGTGFTILCSSGMSIFSKRNFSTLVSLAIGAGSVTTFTILSVFFPIHSALLNTDDLGYFNQWSHGLSLTLAVILLLFHFIHLMRIMIPPSPNTCLNWFLTPRSTYKELRSKKAACYKCKTCIENALLYHEPSQPSSVALSNYFEESPTSENIGNIFWTWKRFVNGRLSTQDGIWFHTRILSSNLVQLFLIGVIAALMAAGISYVNEYFNEEEKSSSVHQADEGEGWSLYVPSSVNPEYTTFLEWKEVHPINEHVFNVKELSIIRTTLQVQPLQLPSDLGSWYYNEKALYFYNTTDTVMLQDRQLVEYSGSLDLLALNQIKGTSYDPAGFTPGEQVLSIGLTELCHDGNAKNDWSVRQECAREAVASIDSVLKRLTDGALSVEESVELAISGNGVGISVNTVVNSLASTVERKECIAGIIAGGTAAILSVLATFVVYIPSYVNGVLQFRSGCIPSLYSSTFRSYRRDTEEASVLFGSALWGSFLSGALNGLFVGAIVFLTIWNESRFFMLSIFGHFFGWLVSVAFKVLFLFLIRDLYVKGLYRDRPGAANVVSLGLECWNIGLAAFYMVLRAVLLFMSTAISIGRADTALPHAFRKDLLMSEAHRHPFLQRLAVLYLTKLRHGATFYSRAGSTWRLLYVLILMPWMRKWRPGFKNYELPPSASSLETTRAENERLELENQKYKAQLQSMQILPTLAARSSLSSMATTSPTSSESGESATGLRPLLTFVDEEADIDEVPPASAPSETLVLIDETPHATAVMNRTN